MEDDDSDMIDAPIPSNITITFGEASAQEQDDLEHYKIPMLSTETFERYRKETYTTLKQNINIAKNFPRNIREALNKYTVAKGEASPLNDEDMLAIDEAFMVMEPLEKSIVVFRGIDAKIEDVNYDIHSIISTSASFDAAEGFRGTTCCMFVISIPAGSKVLCIPDEIHFFGDLEEEILIKGPGRFVRAGSIDDSPLIYLNYITTPEFPVRPLNISRLTLLKYKIETIERINNIATHLGYGLDSIPTDSGDVVATHLKNDGGSTKKYYDILMEEFSPYPFEVMSKLAVGDEHAPPPQPRGPPFSRISIFILLMILSYYPQFSGAPIGITQYETVKNLCTILRLPTRYILIRLGAYYASNIINTIGYTQALEFPLPDKFSFGEHNIAKYVYLLILSNDESTYKRRLEIIRPDIWYISEYMAALKDNASLDKMMRRVTENTALYLSLNENYQRIKHDLLAK